MNVKTSLACFALIALGFGATPSMAVADDVKIEQQGLDAVGNLDIAKGKSLKQDGVVLIVHDTLGHHRMEIISALQELLHERGINSLAITLSLGTNERHGMFDCSLEQDHRNEDAVEEIRNWVEWVKGQGATSVIVAGHARGGNQVAAYASKTPDKVVKKVVLIAPPAQTASSISADYELRFHKPLQPILSEAEKMVADKDSAQLMTDIGFLTCDHARVTAGAFVNYYGANQNLYTPSLLPFIKIPVLVTVGDQDPLAAELTPAIEGIPDAQNINFQVIPGADHFFRDMAAEELANHIRDFIQKK
jgi:dienelactone hydrolase